MNQAYKPVDQAFYEELRALVNRKAHVRIQYFSELREFLTENAALKELYAKNGEAYLQLSTGEEIRLDRIVRVGNKPAPGYDEDYFKCDC